MIPFRRGARVYVAGHSGLVGSALVRTLERQGFDNVLTVDRRALDLRDQAAVHRWYRLNRPEFVFLAAGTVGGILANASRPAEFIYDNLMMHVNVVNAAREYGVEKLLYLGSSCIYPREAPQPIREADLLTGRLEPTNEPYAIAKIAGIKLCQAYRRQYGCRFIAAMPTNLYGPNDNFDLDFAHVLPALMRKFHEAKESRRPRVTIWGTGRPRREFMHVDDLADACVFLMRHYDAEQHINVGTGKDLRIDELALMVREVVDLDAELVFDASRPDGTPRRLLDPSTIHALGWHHSIELRQGIEATYAWFKSEIADRLPHAAETARRGTRPASRETREAL